jgi:hypothetical protein
VSREQIERLHRLLHRVQVRAQERRTNGAAHAQVVAEAATPASASVEVEHRSVPPMVHAAVTERHIDAYVSSEDDADVEVSSETVEVDIDIDEPMPMESGAQPIVQSTTPPEELAEEVEEPPMALEPSRPPQRDDVITQMAPANEIEEPAPSSSRRPIAGEETAETYGEESAPRHTPPPESGKQVAAPSVHPVAARGAEPSAPPPSLEGHMLVGGWREPGLGTAPQIAQGSNGVRVPAPAEAPVVAAQPSGTRLSPDVTRPALAASANVARIEGSAPVAKPATMGELLDMTLSL